MNTLATALFAFAAAASLLVIWHSIRRAALAIRALRAQLGEAEADRFIVTTRGDASDRTAETATRSAASRRRLRPKPTTHRLHHFPRARRAA